MKNKLSLLLVTPALILSACGPTKVSYADYKKKADEAVQSAASVTVKELVLDNSGTLEEKDFKIHEVYTTKDGTLTLDDSQSKYEGDAATQIAARLISAIALSMKANSATEVENYEYAIDPLTVYVKDENGSGEMSFDKYGNMTKLTSKSTKDAKVSEYKLSVSYTYENN